MCYPRGRRRARRIGHRLRVGFSQRYSGSIHRARCGCHLPSSTERGVDGTCFHHGSASVEPLAFELEATFWESASPAGKLAAGAFGVRPLPFPLSAPFTPTGFAWRVEEVLGAFPSRSSSFCPSSASSAPSLPTAPPAMSRRIANDDQYNAPLGPATGKRPRAYLVHWVYRPLPEAVPSSRYPHSRD